jgi:NADH-quinone oxidoreductase subunit N
MPTPKIDVLPLLPELIVAGTAIAALLLAATRRRVPQGALLALSLVGLAIAAAAAVWLWHWDGESTVLGGMIWADKFAVVARLLILGIAAIGALYAHDYFSRLDDARREIYALMLLCTVGMMLFAAASDLIVVFLALEILSLSLYVMVGFSLRAAAGESSMKYFLLGAFSSAFFLYGIAMTYGATGTTNIARIAVTLTGPGSRALALAAVGLLLVGFGFKVSSVPFHMWTPDVYQGAPTPVTAFMSAGTKVAAFLALVRVLDVAFSAMSWDWTPLVWVLAALSVVVGSVLAIAQRDVKRMLAYSSIAHAGFVLTGLTAANQVGVQAAMFYLVSYALMVIGAFGVVMLVSARGEERTTLTSYRGLARTSPLLAGMMTLFLLSLAGIPPTAGFIAKVGVFQAAIGAGFWPLALIGVLASVVAAFFYLRLIVLMYMVPADATADEAVAGAPVLSSVTMGIAAILTLVLGVFPGLVLGFLGHAAVLRW